MTKILGLDLGTNSIGWAIRDTELQGNQIQDKGVVIFPKGMGEDQTGEYSLAKERTNHRQSRRQYERRRLRKLKLLEVLIAPQVGMCPLTKEEMNQWLKPKKSGNRKFPGNQKFLDWLKLNFTEGKKADYKNPYELRASAFEKELSLKEIGRIFYHITQRRGYKSNRVDKNDDEASKIEQNIKKTKEKLNGKTYGQKAAEWIKEGKRVRKSDNENCDTSRDLFEDEFNQIIEKQNLKSRIGEDTIEKIRSFIFEQKPLKSQKGLIGKCKFEKNKTRSPVSHPAFEEFRALQFINSIKKKNSSEEAEFEPLSKVQREQIYPLFLRKSKPTFKFEDIAKKLISKPKQNEVEINNKKQTVWTDTKTGEQYIFNYKPNQTVSGNPTLSQIIDVIGKDTWDNLKENQAQKGEITKELIWNTLFCPTFDKNFLKQFAIERLGTSEEKAEEFSKIILKDGYSELSVKAIRNILPFLREGYIYSHAIFFANMPTVIGKEKWKKYSDTLTNEVNEILNNHQEENRKRLIVNSLLEQLENENYQYSDLLEDTITNYYGTKTWQTKPAKEKEAIKQDVESLYSGQKNKTGNKNFLPLEKIEDKVKKHLIEYLGEFPEDIQKKALSKLYHPSDIDIYPKVKPGRFGKRYLGDPRTGSFKNPMAMRTLFELKHLINYMIEHGKINNTDKIIVETARELNDNNTRKAWENWQKKRENEHVEWRDQIKKDYKAATGKAIEPSENDVIKYRLWEEQCHKCLYTGAQICLEDFLGDNPKFDIEHTFPRSQSFDNSLENKTLADNHYNRQIKSNIIPKNLPNYDETITRDDKTYPPIKPMLKDWEEHVKQLENKLEPLKRPQGNETPQKHDERVQKKRYLEFELDYWRNKLGKFKAKEIKPGFKNSQLVDTQLISRYSVAYLKSAFDKVYSVKGSVVADFRKMWGLQEAFEKKERVNHIHHAIDACTITGLTKDSYDKLAQYWHDAEQGLKPKIDKPWKTFTTDVLRIESEVLINHVFRENTLKQTKRKLRKRGKIQYKKDKDGNYLRDEKGERIPIYETGEGIRKPLHKQTFYGAIKQPEQDEDGNNMTDEDGNLLLEKDKAGNEVIHYRVSFPFASAQNADQIKKNIPKIVDPKLRALAMEKGASAIYNDGFFEIPPNEEKQRKENNPKPRKVFKIKIFQDNYVKNPLAIKEHRTIDVKSKHKKYYYVQNDTNIMMVLYSDGNKENDFELINAFDLANLKKKGEVFYPKFKEKNKRGKKSYVPLIQRNGKDLVIKPGQKVILVENSFDEVKGAKIQDLQKRFYRINALSIERHIRNGKGYNYGIIELVNNQEALPKDDIKKNMKEKPHGDFYQNESYKPFRKMNHNNFKALVENIDFKVTYTGKIQWLKK